MTLTFRQLRIFVEVAQRGSMIRAAVALHLTPPAISMQIKEIERQAATHSKRPKVRNRVNCKLGIQVVPTSPRYE